ncbi:MAG: hypothetical protein L0Y56_01585, partial [Nitrospira sp.]|nr:hypothetical protein [Nitrospira sp.]
MPNLVPVENWINASSLDFSALGMHFRVLKHELTESEDKGSTQRAIEVTQQFLRRLASELKEKPADSLPLHMLFGVLSTLLAEAGPS